MIVEKVEYQGHEAKIYYWENSKTYSVDIFDVDGSPMTVYGTLTSLREARNMAYVFIDGVNYTEPKL